METGEKGKGKLTVKRRKGKQKEEKLGLSGRVGPIARQGGYF